MTFIFILLYIIKAMPPGGVRIMQDRYRNRTDSRLPQPITSGSRPVQIGVPVSQSFQAG